MWTLREEGGTWVRRHVFGCPMDDGEALSLVVDRDGGVRLGGQCPFGGGLVRYAGGGWEAIEELDGMEVGGAIVLGAGTDGARWVLAQQCHRGDGWPSLLGGRMARFYGGEVSTIELPAGTSALDAAPDNGMPLTRSDRGPARFDGQAWQFLYEDPAIPGMSVAAVAPDGSVYGTVGVAILRLPPRPAAPAAESS